MFSWLQQDPGGFLLFMLYRAPAVLLALSAHELAHGYAALRSGDTTARDLGRLTLNPIKHLDLVGTISMFLMGIGWAKPVPVNPNNFRNRRRDDIVVSLAGVSTNFVLFLLATLLSITLSAFLYKPEVLSYYGADFFLNFKSEGFNFQLYPQNDALIQELLKTPWLIHIQRFLFQLSLVNIGMGLFNLLPIPPLDGFHVVNNILFRGRIHMGGQVFRYMQLGLLILLFTTDFVGNWVGKAIYAVQGAVLPILLKLFGAG